MNTFGPKASMTASRVDSDRENSNHGKVPASDVPEQSIEMAEQRDA
ncbi:hypothetical protein J7E70_21750 [Variovorax paradoxus]|nr:hypothetical protein [Variovorax paradoxus]MBT2303080.1 hypothetical protein [Variovorax paradoxus]